MWLSWLFLFGLLKIVKPLDLQPRDRQIIRQAGENSSFFIACRGMAGFERDVTWRRGDKRISALTGDRVHIEPSVGGGIDLVFRSIDQKDQGVYTCTQESQEEYFELVVVQPLHFNSTPRVQMVQLGDPNFRLHCSATGLPFPTVTWKFRGNSIRNSLESPNATSKYEMDGTDLLIRNVEKEDEGRYLCKAVQTAYDKDGVTVVYSDFKDFIIDLRIEQSPEWLDNNPGGQFYGFVTGTANLTCQAEAEPPPTFSWLDAHNNPVKQGTILNADYMSTLLLNVTHHNVFGAYTCIAENVHGRLEKVVMLSEGAKPGTPQIQPSRIYGNSMELSIVKPAAELFLHIEGFQVEIKKTTIPWENATTLRFPLESSGLYNIPGLSQQTFYHVRALSRNKAGLSDPSNIIYLKTNGDSPSPLTSTPNSVTSVDASLLLRLPVLLLLHSLATIKL